MSYPRAPLDRILRRNADEVRVEPTETYWTAGIYSFGRGLFERPPIIGAETRYRSYFRLREGQFVYSKLFAWEGAVAVVGRAHDGLVVSSEFPTFDIESDVALPEYVAALCRWPQFHEAIAVGRTGLGVRRQRVNPERLLQVEIPLPDLAEQRRVVENLQAVLNRIEEMKALSDRIALLASGLRSATTRGKAPGVRLGDVVEQVSRPELVKPESTYRLLGVRSFGAGCFDAGTRDGSETRYRNLHRVAAGDFVFPKLMAWEGAFAVVPDRFDDYVVSPEFCTFRAVEARLDIRYLGSLFRSPETWEAVAGASPGTNVRRRRLYPQSFLEEEIPLPDLNEQRRISQLGARLDHVAELATRRGMLAEALVTSAVNHSFAGLP